MFYLIFIFVCVWFVCDCSCVYYYVVRNLRMKIRRRINGWEGPGALRERCMLTTMNSWAEMSSVFYFALSNIHFVLHTSASVVFGSCLSTQCMASESKQLSTTNGISTTIHFPYVCTQMHHGRKGSLMNPPTRIMGEFRMTVFWTIVFVIEYEKRRKLK